MHPRPTPPLLLLEPPFRFAAVEDELFRGGFPKPRNYGFLKTLQLKTLICLTQEPPPQGLITFCFSVGIQPIHIVKTKKHLKSRAMAAAVIVLIYN